VSDIDSLETLGTEFIKRSIFSEEEEELVYNPKRPLMGRSVTTGKYISIDLTEAKRILILGITRSGKTFVLRRLMDILARAGVAVFVASDPKDEMKSSIRPLQKKFHKLLLPLEQPRASKVVTLRPTFFKQLCDEDATDKERDASLPKDNFWYSPDINKISKGDFMTLLKVKTMGEAQQSTLEEIYRRMKLRMRAGENFSFDLILEEIEMDEEMKDSQKNALKRRLRPLKYSFFHESKWQRNIVDLINKGYIPSLNLEHFDRFGDVGFAYVETILSMACREIITAKINNQLKAKSLWIMVDESARFVNESKKTSFQHDVTESYELHSKYFINWIGVYQTLGPEIPKRILKNSQIYLVPGSADVETIRQAMSLMNAVRNAQSSRGEAQKVKRLLNRHKFSWLMMDQTGLKEVIQFGPPLSEHTESGD